MFDVVDTKSNLNKPIVNIQYINAEDLDNKSYIKPKPKSTTPESTNKNYASIRSKKNKPLPSLFSLSNTGIALTAMGTLDFFAAKQYLAGSLLFGGGLLAYGIGQSLENMK